MLLAECLALLVIEAGLDVYSLVWPGMLQVVWGTRYGIMDSLSGPLAALSCPLEM